MGLSKSCQWCIVHKNHPIIQLAYPCKVSKQSTESIDKPGKITEGAEDDVLMKQGSNEYPSIPDSVNSTSMSVSSPC
jgi:hypothetical protein